MDMVLYIDYLSYMNYLIIYAHPNKKSLNHSVLDETRAVLKLQNTNELQVIDLYEENFNPSLYFDETQPRRNLHTREETEKYRGAILWADHLIFVYPIWWGRPPAILLGFIDKVFVSGFAYFMPPKALMVKGLLKGKRASIITTQNGPVLLTRILFSDTHRKIMKRQLLNFCGIWKVRFFEIGQSESMTSNRFSKIKQKLCKFFR